MASYNVHLGIGNDGYFNPDRIAGVINELQADIVALQEVGFGHPGFDLLAYLSQACRMEPIAGPTMITKHGNYGNGVLTRFGASGIHRLNVSVPNHEPRGALDITFNFDGLLLRLIATHLGLWPSERRSQVRQLLSHIRNGPVCPLAMIGDLNEWFLWGRPVRWLRRYFAQAPSPATFPAGWPLFALDRIWVKPLHALREVSVHKTPLSRIASDHLPIKALIYLVPESTSPASPLL
jgi:endonuclease/exonuclease/phosphatase family metal-dependent hydrolase